MERNISLVGIVVALIVGGALGYAGASYQYGATLQKAKSAFPTQSITSIVSGTVKEISNNVVTLQSQPSPNPFDDSPAVRKVTVTGDTKIVKFVPKDPKILQKELDAFQKTVQPPTRSASSTVPVTLPTPPAPFNEVTLKVSDLKAGDMIMVDAGKDIGTATSFTAVKITVTGSATLLPVPVPVTGAAPIVNTPAPSAPGVHAPIVNTPPPLKK